MNKKLDGYLVEKYSKIFINRYEDMTKTAMCWGFDHGDGWFWLIDQLCDSIQNHIDLNQHKNITQVVATQVKEKFGTLRFYYNGGDDDIDGMVTLAENMSANICEFCGSTVHVGKTSGWITTVCKDCYDTNERMSSMKWQVNQEIPSELFKEIRKIKIDKLNNNVEENK